ncbi:hypothetical protein [Desulfoferula mesophila]|uniref:hypothetical protein n=1 Tax=Desulfoferula mesophila TaxID=3058419 RepID=UPI0030CE385C
MRRKFSTQVSPYGCFPTAVINAFIYRELAPPPAEALVSRSRCDELRGRIDKVKLLRGVRGLGFRRASAGEVLKDAGIITYSNRRYINHSAFFFRINGHAYAVNAQLDSTALVEVVGIRAFLKEYEKSLSQYQHWRLI